MIVFDGEQRARQREQRLKEQVSQLSQPLKIAAVFFEEDTASQLYTRLKQEAARRVGIEYEAYSFLMRDGVSAAETKIAELNQDQTVTGIIIQKPRRQTWLEVKGVAQDKGRKAVRQAFRSWWQFLTSRIALEKDVDGLHPLSLAAVINGSWRQQGMVLPATAAAVVEIFEYIAAELNLDPLQLQVLVLGRSDIVGLPVFYELEHRNVPLKLLNRDDVQQRLYSGKYLRDGDVIITATGQREFIKGNMLQKGVAIIDVGEPHPDVDRASVADVAAFLTPVPGGVGPMTVVQLLQNCVQLALPK